MMRGSMGSRAAAVLCAAGCLLSAWSAPALGGEITGTVTDDTGEPIAGARLRLSGSSHQAAAEADAVGGFTIPAVPPGRYRLETYASDHHKSSRTVTVASDDPAQIDVELVAVSWISGKVLLGSGEALCNAKVALYFSGTGDELLKHLTTGPDGNYRVRAPWPGLQDIVASAPGRGCVQVSGVRPKPGEELKGVNFVFDPQSGPLTRVVGTVTDDTGNPVAGASVLLDRSGRINVPTCRVVTDAEGGCAVCDLLPGSYHLHISATGHDSYSLHPAGVTVRPGETVRHDVTLGRVCRISGTITRVSGEPLGNAKVQMHFRTYHGWRSRTVTTKWDGKYMAECPEPCVADMVVKPPGYAGVERRGVVLVRGEELPEANFVLEGPAGTITGVVYEPDGTTPNPDAGVWLIMVEGPKWTRMSGQYDLSAILKGTKDLDSQFTPPHPRTEQDGTFVLEDIEAGTYRIVAHAPGYLPVASEPIVVGRSGNVTGVSITLRRAAAIHGTLYDPDGQPVANQRIRCALRMEADAGDQYRSVTVNTDEQGRYCIPRLWPGRYDVQLRPYDAAPATRQVQVGEGQDVSGLDFWFREGNALEVLVIGADGAPAADASVSLSKQDAADSYERYSVKQPADQAGRARFEHLPEGSYSVYVKAPGAIPARSVALVAKAPDAAQKVRIALTAGATIEGRVTDEEGRPIPGAEVRAYRRVPSRKPGGLPDSESWTTGIADDSGSFVVESAGPGAWTCSARAPGYVSGSARVEVAEAAEYSVTVMLLRAWSGTLRGNILMPDGVTPAARREFGVELLAQRGRGEIKPVGRRRLVTDAEGTFSLEVDRAIHAARFLAEGLTPATVEIPPSDARAVSVTVWIPPLTGIRGSVELAGGEIPLDGLYVLAARPGESALLPEQRMWEPMAEDGFAEVTPGQTQWEILGIEPGEYQVFTYAPGLAPSAPLAVTVAEGEIAEVAVDVAIPGAVEGRVLRSDGSPVGRAWIHVRTSGGRVHSLSHDTWTDHEGRYRVEGLTPGLVTVSVFNTKALGYARPAEKGTLAVPGAAIDTVDFELFVPGEVRGVVRRRDGKPLTRQYRVELDMGPVPHRIAYVAPDGTFRFERVHPGSYDLYLEPRDLTDFELIAKREGITVAEGQTLGGIEFIIEE